MEQEQYRRYLKIARDFIDINRDDPEALVNLFRLRDEASAAMVRQCCLPDSPDDEEVADWLSNIPPNNIYLARGLNRTGQRIMKF